MNSNTVATILLMCSMHEIYVIYTIGKLKANRKYVISSSFFVVIVVVVVVIFIVYPHLPLRTKVSKHNLRSLCFVYHLSEDWGPSLLYLILNDLSALIIMLNLKIKIEIETIKFRIPKNCSRWREREKTEKKRTKTNGIQFK